MASFFTNQKHIGEKKNIYNIYFLIVLFERRETDLFSVFTEEITSELFV